MEARLLLSFFILLTGSFNALAQCTVTSSNGWTASITVTPTGVIPSTTDCPWYYNWDISYDYEVTFSGSTTNRSVSSNVNFTCTAGSGGTPHGSIGTFTADGTGSGQTNNGARTFTNAGSAYDYGSNPDCNSATVSDVGCSTVSVSYWGSGITTGSTSCSSGGGTLPVTLVDFHVVRQSDQVLVRWATESEQNNDYFNVQRSTDSKDWQSIATINGAGNSSSRLSYDFKDNLERFASAYYRLKQTDYDGTVSYSEVIYVRPSQAVQPSLLLFPLPVDDNVRILSEAEVTDIQIWSVNGVEMQVELDGQQHINTSRLGEGVYVFTAVMGGVPVTRKFTVVHL